MLSSAWDMLEIFVNQEFFLSSVSIAFFHSGIAIAFQKSLGLGLGLVGSAAMSRPRKCDVEIRLIPVHHIPLFVRYNRHIGTDFINVCIR